MSKSRSALALLGFGAAVAGAGWFASRFSPRDPETQRWYERLDKPTWEPPQEAFPVVWTVLYALIAFSGWRTWKQGDSPQRTRALRLWLMQLTANANWTRLFFGQHRPKRALSDILSLESQIVAYILAAREVDRTATALFLPYAAWVAFATLLNAEIVRRNPQAKEMKPEPKAA
jgi:benzodiazapine receptor